MKHPFRQFIENYTPIDNNVWSRVEEQLQRKVYQEGTLVLEQGKTCNILFFVESGLLRFITYQDGEPMTKFFTEAPYCFTSQRSFTKQIPSEEAIEVLENSVVWEISRTAAYELLEEKDWSAFQRKLTEEVQFFTEVILKDIQNKTAEERYMELIETRPNLVQKVQLKHLASYLGIAPQSLSRIRKKYIEKLKS